MPLKVENKSTAGKGSFVRRRTQRKDTNKVEAKSGGGGARAQRSGLRAVLRRGIGQASVGNRYGGMAEREQIVRTAAPRTGSQGTPERMCVVGRNVRRRGTAACSERTRSDDVRIEAFVDR